MVGAAFDACLLVRPWEMLNCSIIILYLLKLLIKPLDLIGLIHSVIHIVKVPVFRFELLALPLSCLEVQSLQLARDRLPCRSARHSSSRSQV